MGAELVSRVSGESMEPSGPVGLGREAAGAAAEELGLSSVPVGVVEPDGSVRAVGAVAPTGATHEPSSGPPVGEQVGTHQLTYVSSAGGSEPVESVADVGSVSLSGSSVGS